MEEFLAISIASLDTFNTNIKLSLLTYCWNLLFVSGFYTYRGHFWLPFYAQSAPILDVLQLCWMHSFLCWAPASIPARTWMDMKRICALIYRWKSQAIVELMVFALMELPITEIRCGGIDIFFSDMYPHQGTNLMQFLLWIALLVCIIAFNLPCKSTCVSWVMSVFIYRTGVSKSWKLVIVLKKGYASV